MTTEVARIIELAKARGVKLAFINKLIGGYRGKATDWKNGKSAPTDDELRIIAGYFNVTVDYFSGAEKPATPEGQPVTRHEELMYEARKELADLPEGDLERILEMVRAYKRK